MRISTACATFFWPARFRHKIRFMKKKILFRAILVFVLLVVLYEIWSLPFKLFSKNIVLPTAEKISRISRIIVSPFVLIGKMNSLEKRNADLEKENNSLNSKIAQNEEIASVCSKLSSEQKLSQLDQKQMVSAAVIGRTAKNYNQKIMIDRGKRDGLSEGAAVLSNGYLIGRLVTVDEEQSYFLPITDHSSLIPAMLQESRETGLIQGGLGGLVLTDVPVNSAVKDGEKILTSGLGGDFPSGVMIGQAGATHKKSGLFQTIEISYPVQISHLEVVSVIK